MTIAIVTGSAGLIGSAAVQLFAAEGFGVVGIDNDLRAAFFGREASTAWKRRELQSVVDGYRHHEIDVRDADALAAVFSTYGQDIGCVIHAAAQPSHDWAARDPVTDFDVNARSTLLLLEQTRKRCPDACFVFMSTNKVYGDRPNALPLLERETRWELDPSHPLYEHGIDETMPVDASQHSLFGASKLAADILVQEYGRYFGMNTVCFRAGCVTGSAHSGTHLHGFLSYLVQCLVSGTEYPIVGYRGKQVRDNLHAADLAAMFLQYCRRPRPGEVYNAGGGRGVHCSLLEAIELAEKLTGKEMRTRYVEQNRTGDHVWYISDTRKFEAHYPDWRRHYHLEQILLEIAASQRSESAPVQSR
jgi:CDP-paratose 2-epimerase